MKAVCKTAARATATAILFDLAKQVQIETDAFNNDKEPIRFLFFGSHFYQINLQNKISMQMNGFPVVTGVFACWQANHLKPHHGR